MEALRVITPVQSYLKDEDIMFEIGDEDIETPKKSGADDDHAGYGFETEEEEGEEPEEPVDEFSDFEWGDEGEDME